MSDQAIYCRNCKTKNEVPAFTSFNLRCHHCGQQLNEPRFPRLEPIQDIPRSKLSSTILMFLVIFAATAVGVYWILDKVSMKF